MAQIATFYIVSKPYGDDLLCEMNTLAECMTEVTDMMGQSDMHRYFPVSVILEDDNGKETRICTVSL